MISQPNDSISRFEIDHRFILFLQKIPSKIKWFFENKYLGHFFCIN